MKDFLGSKITKGDQVIIMVGHDGRKDFQKGLVIGFTPKTVKIESLHGTITRRDPHKILVLEPNLEGQSSFSI